MRKCFKNVTDVIEKINISIDNLDGFCRDDSNYKKDLEVIDNMDFDLAKAFVSDWEEVAVKVAKMILAHKDISDVKVKFE